MEEGGPGVRRIREEGRGVRGRELEHQAMNSV